MSLCIYLLSCSLPLFPIPNDITLCVLGGVSPSAPRGLWAFWSQGLYSSYAPGHLLHCLKKDQELINAWQFLGGGGGCLYWSVRSKAWKLEEISASSSSQLGKGQSGFGGGGFRSNFLYQICSMRLESGLPGLVIYRGSVSSLCLSSLQWEHGGQPLWEVVFQVLWYIRGQSPLSVSAAYSGSMVVSLSER